MEYLNHLIMLYLNSLNFRAQSRRKQKFARKYFYYTIISLKLVRENQISRNIKNDKIGFSGENHCNIFHNLNHQL